MTLMHDTYQKPLNNKRFLWASVKEKTKNKSVTLNTTRRNAVISQPKMRG